MQEPVYFTIGELAKLFGVSKQTLMYYERMELLTPSKVEDNGYRYYTMAECERLELILSLKQLELPLKDILEYVRDRNPRKLSDMFQEVLAQYDAALDDLYGRKLKVQMAEYHLQRAETVITDVVFFQVQEEKKYFETPCDTHDVQGKDREMLVLKHKKKLMNEDDCLDFYTGSVLPLASFLDGDYTHRSKIATGLNMSTSPLGGTLRPRDMYVILYVDGTLEGQERAACDKLHQFMTSNQLTPVGDVYIEPVRHFWTEEDTSQYVTKISIQVTTGDDTEE